MPSASSSRSGPHARMGRLHLAHIDDLDQMIARLDAQIEAMMTPLSGPAPVADHRPRHRPARRGRDDDGGLLALIAHGVPAGAVAGGYMVAGSLGGDDSGGGFAGIHGARGSAARIARIWAARRAWYRPSARPSGRVHSRSRCPWPARSCAACASRALVSSTVWPAVPGGTARVKVTRNSAAVTALLAGVGGGSFGCGESGVTSS